MALSGRQYISNGSEPTSAPKWIERLRDVISEAQYAAEIALNAVGPADRNGAGAG